MAINSVYLSILTTALRAMGKPVRTACMSYPDVIVARDDLEAFGVDTAELEPLPHSQAIREHHCLPEIFGEVFSTESVMRELGVDPVYLDLAALRGIERVVDLNEPLPADLVGQFDMVLDTGTAEHCFNVAQALKNTAELLRPDGCLIAQAPLSMANHGFWNFSPTAYHDFLNANGFKIKALFAYHRLTLELANVQPTKRFHAPVDYMMVCWAQRVKVQPIAWPVQTRYARVIAQAQETAQAR